MKKLPPTELIENQLRSLKAELPTGRQLSLEEKLQLIKAIGGPKTVGNIIKAGQSLPLSRVPFLFSSLDTQLVMNVLANDMTEALALTTKKSS